MGGKPAKKGDLPTKACAGGGEGGELLERPGGVERDRGRLNHGDTHRPGTGRRTTGLVVPATYLPASHPFIAAIDNWSVVASVTHTKYGTWAKATQR